MRFTKPSTSGNPYLEMSRIELAEVCRKASSLLDDGWPSSPETQATLAKKLALLLRVLDRRLVGSPNDYHSPEFTVTRGKGGDPREVFLAWCLDEERAARHTAFGRCSEHILGDQAGHWNLSTEIDGKRPGVLAAESDEGLALALRAIPERWVRRR